MSGPDFIEPRPFAAPPRMPSPERRRGPRLDLLLLVIAIAAIGGLVAAVVLLSRPAKTPPPAPTPVASAAPAAPVAAPVKPPAAPPLSLSTAPAPVPPPAPRCRPPRKKGNPRRPAPGAPGPVRGGAGAGPQGCSLGHVGPAPMLPKIDPMAPAAWGGAAWSNAVAKVTLGDQAYMAKEFDAATRRFRSAAKAMQDVQLAAPLAFDQLVSDGSAAITRGDSETAIRLLGAALFDPSRRRRGDSNT